MRERQKLECRSVSRRPIGGRRGPVPLLRAAGLTPELRDEISRSNCFRQLAAIFTRIGEPCFPDDVRIAFRARNALVIAQEMMRRGLIDPQPLNVQPLDLEIWRRIASLDLTEMRDQLVDYLNWAPEHAAFAEHRYRRFLYLKTTLPEGHASPSPDVDEFWHQHIINTIRYGADCQSIAGRFLHHLFLSPKDEHDARKLAACRVTTSAFYEALFDEPYEETIGSALLNRWA